MIKGRHNIQNCEKVLSNPFGFMRAYNKKNPKSKTTTKVMECDLYATTHTYTL